MLIFASSTGTIWSSKKAYSMAFYYNISFKHTSGEKLPPYLRLSEKAIANSITLKVSK